ncbi:probable Single-stranded DNA-binding protein RIM1, mitochondrial [Nakaseomyces glabratus]|nr:Single-strand binding protein family [Nakaseomyces glabratus]QNG16263.1 uncharacterized protein GWK60_L07139 [Nakaseomyces glabratus]SCV15980.1 probable Single-stranded DNA-binding protein RIM1, mitochondrial [Nakaseomyces glabratus]SLM15650.1 probable Single-stranded DNA-binding protein RIM1, mitochondrial [Nakaseomyces glabratus]
MSMLRQVRQFHATARKLDFSKMSIVGRIGSEFTENTSANNHRYLRYSIASQPRKDGQTNWYNITVFNEPQINFLTQYVRKGALVYVEADAANFTFEREDGTKGTTLSLVQKDFNLLRNGKAEETPEESS